MKRIEQLTGNFKNAASFVRERVDSAKDKVRDKIPSIKIDRERISNGLKAWEPFVHSIFRDNYTAIKYMILVLATGFSLAQLIRLSRPSGKNKK